MFSGRSHLFEGLSFVMALVLVAAYFSRWRTRGRKVAFLTLCALGLLLMTVGFGGTLFTGRDPFPFLGSRLSLLVFAILGFGTLTHERAFTKPELRKYIYPAVCWWFVAWMVVNAILLAVPLRDRTVLLIWDFGTSLSLPPEGRFTLRLILGGRMLLGVAVVGAATTAALSRFKPRGYTFFLPVLLVLFGLMVTQQYVLLDAGVGSERGFSLNWRPLSFPPVTWVQVVTKADEAANRFVVDRAFTVFFGQGWLSFILLAYVYMYTVLDRRLLKEYPRAKHLPKIALFLAFWSFADVFPEYAALRQTLPRLMKFIQYGVSVFEVMVTPALLVVSWGILRNPPPEPIDDSVQADAE
jgi:hypothetical protein